MLPFINIESSAVPLNIENIDTDQIIPARFLKSISREDFSRNLFYDWRYNANGRINDQFNLNNKAYSGSILIAGKNFGCGSSREHAVWALYDYGFRVIVSSHFADIFKNNALNNGLLPVEVDDYTLKILFKLVEVQPTIKFVVNLHEQSFYTTNQLISFHFRINAFKKECLVNGFDSVDYLVNLKDKILDFEKIRTKKEIYSYL